MPTQFPKHLHSTQQLSVDEGLPGTRNHVQVMQCLCSKQEDKEEVFRVNLCPACVYMLPYILLWYSGVKDFIYLCITATVPRQSVINIIKKNYDHLRLKA
jgi:hypothetical protein